MNPLSWLFDTTGFPPRWHCGIWSEGLGWLHIVSDTLIWMAYLAIPAVLVFFLRRRRDLPFPKVLLLFGAFIVVCGFTHLIEAIIFWHPVYHLAGVLKLLTAIISWATVIALIPNIPRVLSMRSPTQLEREVAARTAELTNANDALLKSQQSLNIRDRAISATSQGIIITDATQPANPIVYASAGFERITGYEMIEAVGRQCDFLKGPETDSTAIRQMQESLTNGGSCHVEMINYRKDGTRFWNELSISPVRDDRGQLTHFVAVHSDVSARKTLEEQLRQSQKMDSVGRLAGGVAHDFNNMLTIINGCSDLVLDALNDKDPLTPLLNEIKTAGERAADITRQLLMFSRRQLISPQRIDLNRVVADTQKLITRLLGEDVRLELNLSPQAALVLADQVQMQQVLLNLAINARDAMADGGTLSIATRAVDFDAEYAKSHLEAHAGPHIVLEVTDTGAGLSEEARTRLFEPFFTTKGVASGTGLGLAVVHGIVHQTGGHIEVVSAAAAGTTFRVCIPRSFGNETMPARGASDNPSLPAGSETILIVEDERGVRSFLQNVLVRCGYRVLEAANGSEAIQLAATTAGPIDLVVTDVVMPGLGASQMAEEIQRLHPQTAILFISGYTDDAVVRHGVMTEKVHFLHKPFGPMTLARKVRGVLNHASNQLHNPA